MTTKRTCPRCKGCDPDSPHHWIEDGDGLTGTSCKHCPATAVICMRCGGEGEIEVMEGPGHVQSGPCECCGGAGIAEVVRITRAEVEEVASALRAFVDYYDQAGIGRCGEEDEDDRDDGFDGDEVSNVRHGRAALAAIAKAMGT